jgi:hypothetical protein
VPRAVKQPGRTPDKPEVRYLGIIIALAMLTAEATATPNAATWRRQTLVGENAEYFFRYVTVSENPAEYYSFRRTLRLEKVGKSDLRVVEQVPLRDVSYVQDMETDVWNEHSAKLPPFDLSGYLTRNSVHLPFSDDLIRTFSIDSSGVWEVFDDGRVKLADRSDFHKQIPNLGGDPHIVGIERTDYEPIKGGKAYLFLKVWSNTAASDADWSEDLLLVNSLVFK